MTNRTSADYNSPQYIKWRKAVFRRDGYRCRMCGQSLGGINAHHIHKWADYPRLRFVVKNGITLCKNHHSLVTGQEEVYAELLTNLINVSNKSKYDKHDIALMLRNMK